MTYVKTQLPTLKTHVVNLKRDAKDLSRDLQRLEVRGKLGSKTLYYHDRRAADFDTLGITENLACPAYRRFWHARHAGYEFLIRT